MGAILLHAGKKTDDMITVKEAAIMLGAGVSTVNRYIATGKIQACKIKGSKAFYIRLEDLNDFEKNGSLRTRNSKPKKPKTLVDVLESMSDEEQQALLAALGSVAKVLSMPLTGEQLGLVRGTLENVLNGGLLFEIQREAPELMEVNYEHER